MEFVAPPRLALEQLPGPSRLPAPKAPTPTIKPSAAGVAARGASLPMDAPLARPLPPSANPYAKNIPRNFTELPGYLPHGVSFLGPNSAYRKLLRESAAYAEKTKNMPEPYVPPWDRTMIDMYGEEHVKAMRKPPEEFAVRARRFAREEAERRTMAARASLRGWSIAANKAKR